VKVAIVGSREYLHLAKVREYILNLPQDTIILSGGARGVDKCAEKVANSKGLQTEIYPADWHKYGKAAGMVIAQPRENRDCRGFKAARIDSKADKP